MKKCFDSVLCLIVTISYCFVVDFHRDFVTIHSYAPQPSILKIMQIYSHMTHGVTLKVICSRNLPRDNNIDER